MDYSMTRLARTTRPTRTFLLQGLLALGWLSLTSCGRSYKSEGEKLARNYCASCHAFPEPDLLDKKTWESGVLPQMALRMGVSTGSLFNEASRNPYMMVLTKAVSEEDWQKIVAYYRESAPAALPYQSLPAQPQVDPDFFKTGPFVPRMQSSGIITLLKTDPAHERIFVGEAGSNRLRIFDWNRHLISSLTLGSPPTDLIVEGDHVLVLESGILDPNDEPKGSLVQYDFVGADSLRSPKILIDSLLRPVFAQQFDFDKDGVDEFLICEFGNNRGRLALYKYDGAQYERQVIDPSPGAIRFEIRDMTGDGAPDIVALFAQGDERIVLFENDGKGNFAGHQRVLARFPPVYGSMYFSMHDFNGDGKMDILYVNGDNFDYSRVLKPYHGIRILENDGKNNFHERYFFPVYGAARAEVADFDKDGDLDILTTSNFADFQRHPERGILFLENIGRYKFRPYAFTIASGNQWNLTATADLNKDGWLDVIIGAMDLGNIAKLQRRFTGDTLQTGKDPILFFENRMHAKSSDRVH
jgi:FG-GAP-like repeat